MLTKRPFLQIFMLFFSLTLSGQVTNKLDSAYLFWTEGERIQLEDYRGPSFVNYIPVVAAIGIWTALDLPENDEIYGKPVHFYIAPVCDRNKSFADTNDQALLDVNNIYFDIGEVCARTARQKMSVVLDSLSSYDDVSTAFKAIVKEMHEERLRMNRKFYRAYFREKNPMAIIEWKDKLKEQLLMTSGLTTQSLDRNRFINMGPMETSYYEDISCNAIVIDDKYEQTLLPDVWHAGFFQISRFRVE